MKIIISFIIFGILHSTVGRLFPPFGCECSDFTYFNFQGETVSFLFRKTNSSSQLGSELWAILWICSLLTFYMIKSINFNVKFKFSIGWAILRICSWKMFFHVEFLHLLKRSWNKVATAPLVKISLFQDFFFTKYNFNLINILLQSCAKKYIKFRL